MTRFGGLCLRRPDMFETFWASDLCWVARGRASDHDIQQQCDIRQPRRRIKRRQTGGENEGLRELPVLLKVNQVIFDAKPLWVTVQLGVRTPATTKV